MILKAAEVERQRAEKERERKGAMKSKPIFEKRNGVASAPMAFQSRKT